MNERDALIHSAVQFLARKAAADPGYAFQLKASTHQTVQADSDLSHGQRAVLEQTASDEVVTMVESAVSATRSRRARPRAPVDRATRALAFARGAPAGHVKGLLGSGAPSTPQPVTPGYMLGYVVQVTLSTAVPTLRVPAPYGQLVGDVDVINRGTPTANKALWQWQPDATLPGKGFYPTDLFNDTVYDPARATNGISGWFSVFGAGLGHSFEGLDPSGNSALSFIFGDVDPLYARDVMGYCNPTDFTQLRITFYTRTDQPDPNYPAAHGTEPSTPFGGSWTLLVCPDGTDPITGGLFSDETKAFNLPTSGVTVQSPTTGQLAMYVAHRIGATPRAGYQNTDHHRDYSVLTRFDQPSIFSYLRPLSSLRGTNYLLHSRSGFFLQTCFHTYTAWPGAAGNLPPGDYVLIWGTGEYQKSSSQLRLAAVPVDDFETGNNTRYVIGTGAQVSWSGTDYNGDGYFESSAMALTSFTHGISDFSVAYVQDLDIWIMLFDNAGNILFLWAHDPWGPWQPSPAAPQPVFTSAEGFDYGQGIGKGFIHDVTDTRHHVDGTTGDGLMGPAGPNFDPTKYSGHAFAPMIIERFLSFDWDSLQLTVYFTISTWCPYYVSVMKATLDVQLFYGGP